MLSSSNPKCMIFMKHKGTSILLLQFLFKFVQASILYTDIYSQNISIINMKTQILQRNEGKRYSNSFVLSYPTRTHKIISIKTYSKRKDLIKLERDLM